MLLFLFSTLRIFLLHTIITLSASSCGPAKGFSHTQPNRCCLWGSFGITTASWHGSIPRAVFPRLSPMKSEGARWLPRPNKGIFYGDLEHIYVLHTPPQPVKSKNLVQVSILILLLTFVSQITFKRAVNGLWGSIPGLSLNLAAGLCSGQSWGLTLPCLTSPSSLRRSHSPQRSWYSPVFQGKVSLPVLDL